MSNNVENLMLEHLKRFQGTLERVETKVDEIVMRVGQLEVSMMNIKREILQTEDNNAGLSVRLDNVSKRLDRIERQLELS